MKPRQLELPLTHDTGRHTFKRRSALPATPDLIADDLSDLFNEGESDDKQDLD